MGLQPTDAARTMVTLRPRTSAASDVDGWRVPWRSSEPAAAQRGAAHFAIGMGLCHGSRAGRSESRRWPSAGRRIRGTP